MFLYIRRTYVSSRVFELLESETCQQPTYSQMETVFVRLSEYVCFAYFPQYHKVPPHLFTSQPEPAKCAKLQIANLKLNLIRLLAPELSKNSQNLDERFVLGDRAARINVVPRTTSWWCHFLLPSIPTVPIITFALLIQQTLHMLLVVLRFVR